jgi:hypothetical protein
MNELQKDILGNIYALEEAMLKMQQAEIETINHFADGVYCREMRAPKGSIIVGKMHKFQHINIISKGSIAVATQFGAKIITAPATIISEPGIKRVGLVLEDVVWTTIHPNPTDENDLEKLEELFIAKTIADVPNIKEGICPGLLPQ